MFTKKPCTHKQRVVTESVACACFSSVHISNCIGYVCISHQFKASHNIQVNNTGWLFDLQDHGTWDSVCSTAANTSAPWTVSLTGYWLSLIVVDSNHGGFLLILWLTVHPHGSSLSLIIWRVPLTISGQTYQSHTMHTISIYGRELHHGVKHPQPYSNTRSMQH